MTDARHNLELKRRDDNTIELTRWSRIMRSYILGADGVAYRMSYDYATEEVVYIPVENFVLELRELATVIDHA